MNLILIVLLLHFVLALVMGIKYKYKSKTCICLDETWGHDAKWNKPERKRQVQDDITYM